MPTINKIFAIILAMTEHMREGQMYGTPKCKSICESVARFDLGYLFGCYALKRPQRELLHFLLIINN